MSKYIKLDDAIGIITEHQGMRGDTFKALHNACAVDIVRCRECRWFDSGKNDSEIWSMCTRHFGKYIDVNADDFCSYGEREGE